MPFDALNDWKKGSRSKRSNDGRPNVINTDFRGLWSLYPIPTPLLPPLSFPSTYRLYTYHVHYIYGLAFPLRAVWSQASPRPDMDTISGVLKTRVIIAIASATNAK